MAEYTSTALQTVANGQNVIFTETPVSASRCIVHREGSGIVTLRGLTNCQCRARFRVSFGANIAIPTGGTAGAISVALAIAGEPLHASTAIVTPALSLSSRSRAAIIISAILLSSLCIVPRGYNQKNIRLATNIFENA